MTEDGIKNFDVSELFEKAKAIPPKPDRIASIMPVIQVLRDEKQMDWGSIRAWLLKETGMNHTTSHWATKLKQYKADQKK